MARESGCVCLPARSALRAPGLCRRCAADLVCCVASCAVWGFTHMSLRWHCSWLLLVRSHVARLFSRALLAAQVGLLSAGYLWVHAASGWMVLLAGLGGVGWPSLHLMLLL